VSLDTILSGRCSYEVSRLSVIIRIQEDCTPEVAAVLDVLHKEVKKRNLERNGKRPLREGGAFQDEIEAAIIPERNVRCVPHSTSVQTIPQ
jgi:hypothetical protein